MIIDITGTILTPGHNGKNCLGNGTHKEFECCCDECDYMLCCLEEHFLSKCSQCEDPDCPLSPYCADHQGSNMSR